MRAHRVERAAWPVIGLQAVGLVLGIASQALIAHHFGTRRALDLYAVALTIVAFIADWFLRDAVLFSLVPKLRLAQVLRGAERERTLEEARRIAWAFFGGSLALAAVIATSAPALVATVAPGFAPDDVAGASTLLRWLAPALPFAACGSLLTATLHTRERFVTPAVALVSRSALIVIAVLVGAETYGVLVLPIAFTVGHVLGIAVQATGGPALRDWWLRRHPPQSSASRDYGLVLSYLAIGAAAFLNQLADRYFGSRLPEGSLAELGYAERFRFPIMALFALSVSGPALSFLADSAARNKTEETRETLRAAMRLVARTAWPALIVLFFLRHDLVALWLEHGSFEAGATERVATVLACLIPAFAVNVFSPLLLAAFFSIGVPRALVGIVCLEVALNVALDAWWVQSLGLAGLALATSTATGIANVALWGVLARQLGGLGGSPMHALGGHGARLALLAIVMASALHATSDLGSLSRLVLCGALAVFAHALALKLIRR